MDPSEKGTLVYPSLQGSTNRASPSYSPLTGYLYVPVREMGSIYFKTPAEYTPGTYYTGGSEKRLDEESWGSVRAIGDRRQAARRCRGRTRAVRVFTRVAATPRNARKHETHEMASCTSTKCVAYEIDFVCFVSSWISWL